MVVVLLSPEQSVLLPPNSPLHISYLKLLKNPEDILHPHEAV